MCRTCSRGRRGRPRLLLRFWLLSIEFPHIIKFIRARLSRFIHGGKMVATATGLMRLSRRGCTRLMATDVTTSTWLFATTAGSRAATAATAPLMRRNFGRHQFTLVTISTSGVTSLHGGRLFIGWGWTTRTSIVVRWARGWGGRRLCGARLEVWWRLHLAPMVNSHDPTMLLFS